MNELTVSSFKLLKNGLEPVGSPSFEQWEECGKFLKNANGAVHFWIGDWLNYGERKWGEMYSQALEETDYNYGTLRNDKWVASRVDLSLRGDNLSFSHYKQIADLEPEEQKELLTQAVDQQMPVSAFSKAVHQYKLKLDTPELTDEQRQPVSAVEFEKVQAIALMLLEVTEDISSLNLESLHPQAKSFLFSQVKKSIGILARVIQ